MCSFAHTRETGTAFQRRTTYSTRQVRETSAWLPGHSNRKQSVIHACDTFVGISRAPTIWNSSTVGKQVRRESRAESLTRCERCSSMEDSFCSAPNTTWRGVLSAGRKCQESLHATWSGYLSWSVAVFETWSCVAACS